MSELISDNLALQQRIRDLGPWFHNMNLNGVWTAPDHFLGNYPLVKWQRFENVLPQDMRGMTVLDVGCNAGFYSLEMKRRGADRVVAIDSDDRYLAQARFAAEQLGHDIELRNLSVYDLHRLGERFDLVIFMGVLYHLRHPLLALDLLHEYVVGDLLLFQSMLRGSLALQRPDSDYAFENIEVFEGDGWPRMYFVEQRYADDPTNWWIPDASCVAGMLRSSGFEIVTRAEEEVFLCRRGERPAGQGSSTDYVPSVWEDRIDRGSQDLE